MLLRRLNPFGKPWKVPTSAEVNSQLIYMSSIPKLEEAVKLHTDLYLRCPVSKFGTLAWDEWGNIEAAAEPYVQDMVKAWRCSLQEAGDSRTRTWSQSKTEKARPQSGRLRQRAAS